MRGSLTQRSKGTWRIRYDGPRNQGKRTQVTETVRGTRRDAERVLRERLASLDNGTHVQKQRMTLAQFLEEWFRHRQVSPRTIRSQRFLVQAYITPSLGGIELQKLSPLMVQNVYTTLLDRLRPSSVRTVHRVLRSALNQAVKWGLVAQNVCARVTVPTSKSELRVWDVPTINKFLEAAESSPYWAVYKLALLTGMRRSELCALKWANVDLEGAKLRVVEGGHSLGGYTEDAPKTEKSRRTIALSPETVRLLAVLPREGQWVFGVSPSSLSHDFHDIVVRAGLPALTLHGLRHCHATLLLMAGINPKAVSERLGHASVVITLDLYSHVLPGIQEAAALAIDQAMTPEG